MKHYNKFLKLIKNFEYFIDDEKPDIFTTTDLPAIWHKEKECIFIPVFDHTIKIYLHYTEILYFIYNKVKDELYAFINIEKSDNDINYGDIIILTNNNYINDILFDDLYTIMLEQYIERYGDRVRKYILLEKIKNL